MKTTLKQFNLEKREQLRRFNDYWLENMSANPDLFPMEMNDGDWDQQFEFFVDEILKEEKQ